MRVQASDYPEVGDDLDGALSPVLEAAWVTASFEHGAARGTDPGPPAHVG